MTLQQLRYVTMVAETGTITEAANRLYISQPSLTNAIHELEKEMNIVIFNRTNKGISLSREGEDFLGYARQILEQAAILEDKYKGNGGGKKQYCVSTQHYSFAVNAFVDLIKEYGQDEYDFSLRETQTYEIIEDVARLRSEIGILFLNDFNEAVINKILKSYDLEFHQLYVAKPHVFISRKHPLAGKDRIINEELEEYTDDGFSDSVSDDIDYPATGNRFGIGIYRIFPGAVPGGNAGCGAFLRSVCGSLFCGGNPIRSGLYCRYADTDRGVCGAVYGAAVCRGYGMGV